MNSAKKGLFWANLSTILMSSSGVLGRLITIPSPVTTLLRCVFGAAFLTFLSLALGRSLNVDFKRHYKTMLVCGFFLALHWSTYFYALQISNVSITIMSVFTYSIMTTLLEPLFFGGRMERFNLFNSVVVVIGLIILVPDFNLENRHTMGIIVGLFSGLCYAIRNITSKKLVEHMPGEIALISQLVISSILLMPAIFYFDFNISQDQWIYIGILSVLVTVLGHLALIFAFKNLSTSSASILTSIQPVYAILLAVVIVDEVLETNVIIGGGLILIAVVLQNLLPTFMKKKSKE
ncbi:MAG: DMT family transporter [Bacteroidetes bacterium]|nr:DMT family transporter [Bacteroidota bacterium]MDA1119917.1 DMT family transporter [Bacteroidota bacterium]